MKVYLLKRLGVIDKKQLSDGWVTETVDIYIAYVDEMGHTARSMGHKKDGLFIQMYRVPGSAELGDLRVSTKYKVPPYISRKVCKMHWKLQQEETDDGTTDKPSAFLKSVIVGGCTPIDHMACPKSVRKAIIHDLKNLRMHAGTKLSVAEAEQNDDHEEKMTHDVPNEKISAG